MPGIGKKSMGAWNDQFNRNEIAKLSHSISQLAKAIEELTGVVSRLEAAQPTLAPEAANRRCPECRDMLEDGSVYCDACGTDTPRQ
jgi:hypothetical protein